MAPEGRNPTQTHGVSVPPEGDPSGLASADALPGLDLAGVQRRDPDALAALFDRYFDRLYAVVYRLLGNRDAAEDALQDVFLKIHRGAPTLDPARDPGPWLVTIAANVVRDRWRSGAHRLARASRSIEEQPAIGELLTRGTHDPERDLVLRERAALVQSAITKLKPDYREVLVLREYEGLSYDQIASITGVNETAVRKRFSRALEELGRHLKKAEL